MTRSYLAATLALALLLIHTRSPITATAQGDPYCAAVLRDFSPCIPYLSGMSLSHRGCCEAVEALNYKANLEKEGPKLICQCIEDMAYVMNIRFLEFRIAMLGEEVCHVSRSFPISNSMDCSKVGEL